MPLPNGKLAQPLLVSLLQRIHLTDPAVIVKPGLGADGAAIDLGDGRFLVAAADPITFPTDRAGWYAVHVNANDVAAMGATPRWYLMTLLVPTDWDAAQIERVFDDTRSACEELAIDLVGGHTEVTPGIDRPLIAGQMLGMAEALELTSAARVRPGDRLLLTKGVAIEGTSIIATERRDDIVAACGESVWEKARSLAGEEGISVVTAARLASGIGAKFMHDPTEGGVATAIHELALAIGHGVKVTASAVHVYAETAAVCRHFGLDPLGLIASGSLLIVVAPDRVAPLVATLADADIPCAEIGEVLTDGEVTLRTATRDEPMPLYEQDELTKVLP